MPHVVKVLGGFVLFFLFGVSLYELWVKVGPATSFTVGMWILYSRGLGQKMFLTDLALTSHLSNLEHIKDDCK